MNKKVVVVLGTIFAAGALMAAPHGHHGGFRPVHHYSHHGGFWGRGGSHFWPGFVGGVAGSIIGGTIYDAVVGPRYVAPVVTTPVVTTPVVTTPVVATPVVTTPVVNNVVVQPVTTVQNVWVPGCYVDQMQANGQVIRVWQPGHYEQRTVVVQ